MFVPIAIGIPCSIFSVCFLCNAVNEFHIFALTRTVNLCKQGLHNGISRLTKRYQTKNYQIEML